MGQEQAKIDPKEAAKEQKKIITRAQRKLERESKKLETHEAKMMKEVKKMAQNNQHAAAKIMAKDIARNRQQRTQYLTMSS